MDMCLILTVSLRLPKQVTNVSYVLYNLALLRSVENLYNFIIIKLFDFDRGV